MTFTRTWNEGLPTKGGEYWCLKEDNTQECLTYYPSFNNRWLGHEGVRKVVLYWTELAPIPPPKRFCKGCQKDVTEDMYCVCLDVPLSENQTLDKESVEFVGKADFLNFK